MNNEKPIDSTGWMVFVWSDRHRRWEPFREQPWEPARVYWALVTFLRLGTEGCSVRLIGPGNIAAAECLPPKKRTNLKKSRPVEWFLEIDGKRIGMSTCYCRRCKAGKSHAFSSWESAVDGLRRCPYFAGLPIRIVKVDNSFPKGDGK